MSEVKLVVNVTDFLRQYESINTKMSYRDGIKQFFELIYPELKLELREKKKKFGHKGIPPEILMELLDAAAVRYLEEDRNHRDDILTFKESLSEKSPKTRIARLNAARVFLDENGISFPKRFFKNLNGKVTEAISRERIPNNDELKRIVEYMPVQGKALALVLASSSMRVGEAVKLRKSDVEFDKDPVKVRIRAKISKTGKRRITFISSEAKDALLEWLKYRDQYIEQANGRSVLHKRAESDSIFPFRAANFNAIWNNALRKAELFEVDPRTRRVTMRPHNLRKFFRLRVGKYGRDEAEALMGHQAGLNRVYARFEGQYGDERLKEVYVKALPELLIYERTVKSTKAQMDILKENRKLREDVDLLKSQRDELWTEIDKLTTRVERFESHIQRMIALEAKADAILAERMEVDEHYGQQQQRWQEMVKEDKELR